MILDFNKSNEPRRTFCQKCDDVLIPGTGNLDAGANVVICPKCQYIALMEAGMVPEQMISDDVIHNPNKGVGEGWGIGLKVSIKGLPDFEMVFPEDQINNFIERIKAARDEKKEALRDL